MAFDVAILENPRTGQIRRAPVGFSWTMFFFGFFAPLFRGDGKWALIIFLLSLGVGILSAGFLGWIPAIIGAFMWNKSYLDRQLSDGFLLKATEKGTDFERLDSELGYKAKRIADHGF